VRERQDPQRKSKKQPPLLLLHPTHCCCIPIAFLASPLLYYNTITRISMSSQSPPRTPSMRMSEIIDQREEAAASILVSYAVKAQREDPDNCSRRGIRQTRQRHGCKRGCSRSHESLQRFVIQTQVPGYLMQEKRLQTPHEKEPLNLTFTLDKNTSCLRPNAQRSLAARSRDEGG
jgi:hypothetical protein